MGYAPRRCVRHVGKRPLDVGKGKSWMGRAWWEDSLSWIMPIFLSLVSCPLSPLALGQNPA